MFIHLLAQDRNSRQLLGLVVQEEGVKQIQNSDRKQDVVNPIVEIPFAKHFCYLYKHPRRAAQLLHLGCVLLTKLNGSFILSRRVKCCGDGLLLLLLNLRLFRLLRLLRLAGLTRLARFQEALF